MAKGKMLRRVLGIALLVLAVAWLATICIPHPIYEEVWAVEYSDGTTTFVNGLPDEWPDEAVSVSDAGYSVEVGDVSAIAIAFQEGASRFAPMITLVIVPSVLGVWLVMRGRKRETEETK